MFGFRSKNRRIVTRRRVKWLAFFLFGVFIIMGVIYGSVASSKGERAADYTFFKELDSRTLVIAHRGGAGLAPENTLYAFEQAVGLGVDILEMDVRSTADGTLVVFHDAMLERTTDGSGKINEKTLDELKKLNAGFHWTPDGGKTFPFRESEKIKIPTLQEVFTAFPKMRFNIEPKQFTPSIIKPLCAMIREHQLTDRVVIASFNQTILDEFRRECAGVATSAGPSEIGKFLTMYKTGLSQSYSPLMQALQIPEYAGMQLIDKEFIKAAHERNLQVHVWTVNDTESMQRLLNAGVDGIMTDYPDRLLTLLGRKSEK
jgi:glycerophosphoryl diester phosphodiesterase